jgi:IS5 family transposase
MFNGHQRNAQAKQFRREQGFAQDQNPAGPRQVRRKTADNPSLGAAFSLPLSLAYRFATRVTAAWAKKIYSLHAQEVECIGFP